MLRAITTLLATTLNPAPQATSPLSRTSCAWSSTRVTQSKTKLEYRDLRPCFGTKTRPTRDACLVNLFQKCLYMFQTHFDFLYMSIIMFIVTHVCFGNSQKRIPKMVFRLPRELTNLDLTTLTWVIHVFVVWLIMHTLVYLLISIAAIFSTMPAKPKRSPNPKKNTSPKAWAYKIWKKSDQNRVKKANQRAKQTTGDLQAK